MFRYKFLRNILVASVFIAFALPALSYYIYYPSVVELFTQEKEKEAVRVANHLSAMLLSGHSDTGHASQFVAHVQKMAPHLGHEFNVLRIKLYSDSGELLFSSDAEETGQVLSDPYFQQEVAAGQNYTKVEQELYLADGQELARDVVEAYVPIVQDGRFIGAYNIHFDITADKAVWDQQLFMGFGFWVVALFSLLAVLIFVLRRTAASLDRQRQAELMQHEGDERVRATLQNALDCIVTFDEQGKVLEFNPAAERTFGFSHEEMLGRPISETLLPLDQGDAPVTVLHNGVITDQSDLLGKRLEQTALHANGQAFPIELAITRSRFHGRTLFTAYIRDITERKRAEQALVDARREAEAASLTKSQFLATMSHEIRTPMNGVLGMAELLADSPLNEEQQRFVDTINQSGKVLMGIINDVLDFSKIEAGKLTLESVTFDLGQVVCEVAQLLVAKAESKGLALIIAYAPSCPRYVIGDAGRIRQVMFNLLGNAIKFTAAGHVLINVSGQKVKDGGATIRIEVQDTGIGISSEAQAGLFDAFIQADNSTTREYGGTGLGLAICKQLITHMGGRIGVDSRSGEGATFWLELKLPLAEKVEPLPQAELRGVRVLLVDAHPTYRGLYAKQLTEFGLRVDVAADVDEGMRLALSPAVAEGCYEACIINEQESGIDAFQFAKIFRAEQQLARVPLVLVTAAGQRGDSLRYKEAGYAAYLTRPLCAGMLCRTLAGLLGAKQQGVAQESFITRHRLDEEEVLASANSTVDQLHGRVLLVEDNLVNQKVAVSMLGRFGLEVAVAGDGKAAIARWEGDVFDLILMDCQMPIMDGYAATEEIRRREQETGKHVPIIALTANAMEQDRKRCLAVGMDGYVSKPFTQHELSVTLSPWLAEGAVDEGAAVSKETVMEKAAVIDKVRLNALREALDDEDFEEVVAAFTQSLNTMLDEMASALAEGDMETLGRLAHSTKSASANLGAMCLSEQAKAMEEGARSGELELSQVEERIAVLRQEFERARSELEAA